MRFLILFILSISSYSFCGFYVAKGSADLFNKSSKVVYVRDQNRSVITMSNDYRGAASEFAFVVPIPYILDRDQIHVTEQKNIDHLDAFTAPRLVEYFDKDPCRPQSKILMRSAIMMEESAMAPIDKSLGVTIERTYTVGEYDILILSAQKSNGLQTWLDQNGYKTPSKARKALKQYINMGMKFFVVKVNMDNFNKSGREFLRPIQLAFESDMFMLPIKLGMANADGDQELFIYFLTKKGRVESKNYRMEKLPTGENVPEFVDDIFDEFYPAVFDRLHAKNRGKAIILEHAWDMGWCDPCASDPLSNDQLRELGVYWDNPNGSTYVTRHHLRYNHKTFPEDLMFEITDNRSNYQSRFVINRPWSRDKPAIKPLAREGNECRVKRWYYFKKLTVRQSDEKETLSRLTGWSMKKINSYTDFKPVIRGGRGNIAEGEKWWKKIWDGQ